MTKTLRNTRSRVTETHKNTWLVAIVKCVASCNNVLFEFQSSKNLVNLFVSPRCGNTFTRLCFMCTCLSSGQSSHQVTAFTTGPLGACWHGDTRSFRDGKKKTAKEIFTSFASSLTVHHPCPHPLCNH